MNWYFSINSPLISCELKADDFVCIQIKPCFSPWLYIMIIRKVNHSQIFGLAGHKTIGLVRPGLCSYWLTGPGQYTVNIWLSRPKKQVDWSGPVYVFISGPGRASTQQYYWTIIGALYSVVYFAYREMIKVSKRTLEEGKIALNLVSYSLSLQYW